MNDQNDKIEVYGNIFIKDEQFTNIFFCKELNMIASDQKEYSVYSQTHIPRWKIELKDNILISGKGETTEEAYDNLMEKVQNETDSLKKTFEKMTQQKIHNSINKNSFIEIDGIKFYQDLNYEGTYQAKDGLLVLYENEIADFGSDKKWTIYIENYEETDDLEQEFVELYDVIPTSYHGDTPQDAYNKMMKTLSISKNMLSSLIDDINGLKNEQ